MNKKILDNDHMNIFMLFIFFFLSSQISAYVVLIDPGHGGEDYGARNKILSISEKDLALQLALKLYHKLNDLYTTHLTRSIDRSLTLQERAELAEKVQADIFISIHINGSHSEESHGFETYYLNDHQEQVIKKVEHFVGAGSIVDKILLDLIIERTAPNSKRLAAFIHKEISSKVIKHYKIFDRGIKPSIFYVLALSKRPAVLLEPGFITNKEDTKRMLTKRFQEHYTNAVTEGIKKYFNRKKRVDIFF